VLVLSRRVGESIVIDGRITVTVAEIRPGEVRLGIDAPRSIPVHRKEVFDAIAAENVAAARGEMPDLKKLSDELGKGGLVTPQDGSGR
jgi:carbon storage regulator